MVATVGPSRPVRGYRLGVEIDWSAEVVDQLASGPTVALGLTKWLLNAGVSAELHAQLANEAFALELSSRTDDFREGIGAFRDKRAPRFGGR